MLLEVFKTGTHTDSNGNSCDYTADSLDKIAENYRMKLNDNPKSEAPIVVGHPESSDGALGWVKKLFRRGNSLIADVDINDREFAESIDAKIYRNVSIALDSNLNFVHLGFLGAVPPALENLDPMKYSAISRFTIFDDKIADITYREDVCRLEQENANYRDAIEQYENKLRKIEYTTFINSVFGDSESKYFSKDQTESMVSLLEMAHKLDSNSVDNKATNEVKSIIKDLAKLGRKLEFSKNLTYSVNSFEAKRNLVPERNSLHLKALGIMHDNPELSYEEALSINQ